MSKIFSVFIILFLFIHSSFAQLDFKNYLGNWEGKLPDNHIFNFNISIEDLNSKGYNLIISNSEFSLSQESEKHSDDGIVFNIDKHTRLIGGFNHDKSEFSGFLTSGILMYHVNLKKSSEDKYIGIWNPLMIDSLQSQSIYLSFEQTEDGSFVTYPFFGDQRFTGTWAGNFTKNDDVISFRDFKTGLNFKATVYSEKIQLEILLSKRSIAVTNLTRSNVDLNVALSNNVNSKKQKTKTPEALNDGWITESLEASKIQSSPLIKMMDSINVKALVNTHSVLISKNGKLVFEAYFDGYNRNIPHDQRSASKSIASAMVGIGIEDKIIKDVNQSVYNYMPEAYQNTKTDKKSKIRIKDLLTMSSGLDAIDFGLDRNSVASEGNYQNSNDWLQTVLDAPMVYEPGSHANYGSANPFLLGVSLNEQLDQPLEMYMDQKLFSPLGITNYIIQTENTATTPYFGGGMYLTPRDMLKFGQLFLNKGKWKGERVLTEKWVNDSFKKYLPLENATDKNDYGYLWWHKTYTIGNKTIKSIEARGAGGQYIFVIPELETVVVITSGNFRNGKFQQPENILEDYILPALIN